MPGAVIDNIEPIIGSPESDDRKSVTASIVDGTTGSQAGSDRDTGGSNPPIIEPATLKVGDSATGRRRSDGGIDGRTRAGRIARGRSTGTTASADTPAASTNLITGGVIDFTGILVGIHGLAATLTGFDGLVIEDDEATKLSEALLNVAKFYPVGFDPKKMAWVNLAIVAGNLYGPRAMAYRLDRMSAKKEAPAPVEVPKKTAPRPTRVNGVPEPAMYPSQVWPTGTTSEDNN